MTRTLLTNGYIHTPGDPGATAMLIEDGRISWIGHEGAALAHKDGVDTEVDLHGALVTPAFVDGHCHVTATGIGLTGLDLSKCHGREELLAALQARSWPSDLILFGHGWEETHWSDQQLPSLSELDAATGDVPVFLTRVDLHSSLVNSAMLARLPQEVTAAGAAGHLDGHAHHMARGLIYDLIGPEQRELLVRRALHEWAAQGVALVTEMAGPEISSWQDARYLADLDDPGLPELALYWGEIHGVARAQQLGAVGAGGDLFADGSIGSATASLCQPYAEGSQPGTGNAYLDTETVAAHVEACTRAGIQAGFHAIGDAAIEQVAAGLAAAADVLGVSAVRRARHRIEHLEMVSADLVPDLAHLGVTASMQPAFDELWGGTGELYEQRLGRQRAATMNPFAALAGAGVPLAFGSDSPVTAIDPWGGVAAAVHHHNPASGLAARAAFNAHTRGGWRAVGRDDAGVLAAGAPATLAIWDCEALAVQEADERVSRWSTDPRSGTPMLPLLTAQGSRPTCLATLRHGRTIYTDGRILETSV